MNSIELISENLRKSRDRVLARIEDMREHCVVFPTPNGGCHTIWLLGHMAYIEALVVSDIMLGETNPLAQWQDLFDGDEVAGEKELYPPFDLVLAKCREMREKTLTRIESFCEDDLEKASVNSPNNFEDTFGTYRLCLQFVADHWYMHRGQLADARRAAGLERMWL